jgi:hypothetical protein
VKIRVEDLQAGDVLVLIDWNLHVISVESDGAVAVFTAEFDSPIHFLRDERVNVEMRVGAAT